MRRMQMLDVRNALHAYSQVRPELAPGPRGPARGERAFPKPLHRHHLSQPAMSRVLQRLRETFGDELLIRTANGYELTARAVAYSTSCNPYYRSSTRMLRGEVFNPLTAEDTFRICSTELSLFTIASRLPGRLKAIAPGTQLELVAWHDKSLRGPNPRTGRCYALGQSGPIPLLFQELLEDDIICALCGRHPDRGRTADKKTRICVIRMSCLRSSILGCSIVDTVLAKNRQQRRVGLRVPYFGAAVWRSRDTDLIATLPRRAAEIYAREAEVRIAPFPFKIPRLRYLDCFGTRAQTRNPRLRGFASSSLTSSLSAAGEHHHHQLLSCQCITVNF